MSKADFPAGRWRARWIWCEAPRIEALEGSPWARLAARDCVTACFRRTLSLDAVPARVPARFTADSRYVLWVNGVEVARGPVRSNGRRLHYDEVDLAPRLRRGRNAIAVLARFFGRANPWWAPVPAGLQLGAGAFLFEARLDASTLGSDASWRTLRADCFAEVAPSGIGGMPTEVFDARGLAAGWRAVDFDDAGWKPALELAANSLGFAGRHEPPSHPYGPLRPRPCALLGCEPRAGRPTGLAAMRPAAALQGDPVEQVLADQRVAGPPQPVAPLWPLRIAGGPDAAWLVAVDFGEIVSGTVTIELDAPAGTRVDAAGAEFATADGRLAPDGERAGFRYVARGDEDRYETFQPLGLRYLGLSIRAAGPALLRAVAVNERLHPRPAPRPTRSNREPFFECSDPLLNRIFSVGRRSVDLCSHDAYLDCPTREQRAWTGDFVVHQMVDFATNPDWRLALWNVELTASPRPDGMLPMAAAGDIEHFDAAFIPDWALHWIRALHNAWRYAGDRAYLARLLPVAEGVLRWFEPFAAEDGLLSDVTGWVIIDWSSVSVDGKSSVLNALWARGLLDFAELAEWLGDAGRAHWARALHARLRDAFELFWDPQREIYVDHAVADERRPEASQHAQAAPLAAALVPAGRTARVVEVMLDRTRQVHATWSRAAGDARVPAPGERGVAGPYLILGPPKPWWDVARQLVVAQPFFRYVVHDALAAAGRADLIADQCRDWEVLLARCETSWSETWYGGTVSHGWGSTPTRDLLVRTLGVEPAEPGFALARVAPRLGALAWARGAVPTPSGLLAVSVDAERIEVESPVPFVLDPGDAPPSRHPRGRHLFPPPLRNR
jgi:alpha-L-rhamnosidase